MKILFCTNAFETVSNGPAKFAHLLLKINEMFPEHEIRILTEDCTEPSSYVYRQKLNIPRLFKPAGMFLRMFQYHRRAMQIRKQSFAFDTLVYNNAIVSVWSGLRFGNTTGFINDDNNAGVSWSLAAKKLKFTRNHIFYLVEKLATRVTDKTIVNSNYLKSLIIKNYKVPERKIFRLYKAIETHSIKCKSQNTIPNILFVKNDYVRGGLFDLISALRSIQFQGVLTIAGTPQSANEKILAACAGGKFALNITGIIPQSEVYAYMEQADIFCVPSRKEALGVANMEAMAHGCSVISTNAGGIPEVMDGGACGWLVEPGDIKALGNAIEECLENSLIRDSKKNHASIFIQKFSLPVMLQEFINILATSENV